MRSWRILAWSAFNLVPVLAWAGTIFWLSGRSADEASDYLGPLAGVRFVSEAFHFGEYLVLALLVLRALNAWRDRSTPAPLPVTLTSAFVISHLSVIAAMSYALSDEYHQTFVPGRTFSVEDLAIDLGGSVSGVGIAWAWLARKDQRLVRERKPSI